MSKSFQKKHNGPFEESDGTFSEEYFILMEYCPINLSEKNFRHPPKTILIIFAQIISAVTYMHERGIAHGDLNPTNLLYSATEHHVKICDFGSVLDVRYDSTKNISEKQSHLEVI